jgi:parvulin-like peptidyl-prolyl isomerase
MVLTNLFDLRSFGNHRVTMDPTKTSLRLLAAGVGLGAVLVGFNLFAIPPSEPSELSPGIAALVNGRPISMEDYGRVIASFEADRREPTTAEDRARLLDRLVEEELLVQRGIAVDLPTYDDAVRSVLVQSMIATTLAVSQAIEPKERDLRAYYQENRAFFTLAPQLHVRVYRFSSLSDAQAAKSDVSQLPNPDRIVPDGLLPSLKLREYLGPTVLQETLKLNPGDLSKPIEVPSGVLLIELVDNQPGSVAPYEDIKTQVAMAYQTASDEKTLRETIDRLKKQADISRVSTE